MTTTIRGSIHVHERAFGFVTARDDAATTSPDRQAWEVVEADTPAREDSTQDVADRDMVGIEPVAAKRQQGGAALVACQHLVQRQLARLDTGHELLQLLQGRLVAGRFGGRNRGCRGLGHGGGGSARMKNR